ncbi:hypothetical protein J7J84_02050 [bacterium]|nr:hypothetical protein [bacterium]
MPDKYKISDLFNTAIETLRAFLSEKENLDLADVYRLAAGLSLATCSQSSGKRTEYNRKGKEFNDYSFDSQGVLKIACAVADSVPLDEDESIRDSVEYHVNRGLEMLSEMHKEASGDRLQLLNMIAAYLPDVGQEGTILLQAGEIRVYVGNKATDNKTSLHVTINAEGGDRSNPHVAIAGGSGVGKTQLLLSLLVQALQQTPECGCLLFDYKGDLSRGSNWEAIEGLGFQKYSLGRQPYPINPLRLPAGAKPEMAAQEFAETCRVHNKRLGPKQLGYIRRALIETYAICSRTQEDSGQGDLAPSLSELRAAVQRLYDEENKPSDMVTELFDQLASFNLFEESEGLSVAEFLSRRVVLDVSQQAAFRELSAFFVLHFILQGLRLFGESAVREVAGARYRALRSIIAIDEADKYLGTRPEPIYEILRTGRSFGVCLWLSSQSIADFEAKRDEFVNNVETWFLFQQGVLPSVKALAGLLKIDARKATSIHNSLPSLSQGNCYYRHEGSPTEIVAAQLYKKEEWPV